MVWTSLLDVCLILCWNALVNLFMFLQAALGEVKYLSRIATQCRGDELAGTQCVTSYYVSTAVVADDGYTAVCGTDSCPQLFTGNEDTGDVDDVVTNEFDWPIAARFVRLNPQGYIAYMSLRWEVYGCDILV